ncbi:phosphoribosylformylglycinamidine synthase subunit PurL [Candidatus Curtissbacteria bacterium]|nr:phosphoribosylformylglycinamidine synthase subunit PurL [Candidatus Curtissbacteria bacterium]
MICTVRVTSKSKTDSKGQGLAADARKILKIKSISNIKTAKVYRLEGVSQKQALKIAQTVLWEPIDQEMSCEAPIIKDAKKIIEIAYKPGVMNPEVSSIIKGAKDIGIELSAADSSYEYGFYGNVTQKEIEEITKRLLVNENIEYVVKKTPQTLLIKGTIPKTKLVPIRKLSNKSLMELSSGKLFLNLEEMKVIQNYFKDLNCDPTDIELEIIAQTWSEHCGHKTFKAKVIIDGQEKEPFIKRIKSTAKNNSSIIVSAFVDNSGVIDFYDGYGICGKVETHNSPSAIEPYGGAMTGAGGVFRDILGTGQGAKIISASDIFCFAPWDLPEKELPPGCLPPDYLFRKVVYGIRDYGNRVGIPTNNGSVHFHKDFKAKPTVAAGAYGLILKEKAIKKSPQKGDLIVVIGGRTGRDGIHGATFSSSEMTHQTIDTASTAVQIGNAIEEKRVIDAVLDMSDHNLIRAITDCGAGGLSSAVGEMGESTGAKVQLDRVPLKYAGLAPWEIFLSESQERMVMAISPKNLKKVNELSRLHNVESAVIGTFTGNKKLELFYRDEKVGGLQMEFIHNGLPQRVMVGKSKKANVAQKAPRKSDLLTTWKKVLSHGNVASKESFVRMYDHNVQGTSALHPFSGKNYDGPNDGVILRPIYDKPYGFVTAHGLNPAMTQIDSYWGSIWAIAEAVANYVSVGGDIKDAALIDNFIWPFPDEESLADLDKSVDACVDIAKILNMPFISGKDSLSSTYRYPSGKILKIPPVLIASVFGKIPDVAKSTSSDFKKSGSTLVLLGRLDLKNLGGTTYFDVASGSSSQVPKVDLENLKIVLKTLTEAIRKNQILACHDISEGGLATALCEMSFGGDIGAEIDLSKISTEDDENILFSETPGTFLLEVDSSSALLKQKGLPLIIIGKTLKKETLSIRRSDTKLIEAKTTELKKAWQTPIKEVLSV